MSPDFHAVNVIFLFKVDAAGCESRASNVVWLSFSDQDYVAMQMGCLSSSLRWEDTVRAEPERMSANAGLRFGGLLLEQPN